MDIQKIKELALANGFSLKEQASGNMDLHSYVYEFAQAIVVETLNQAQLVYGQEGVTTFDTESLDNEISSISSEFEAEYFFDNDDADRLEMLIAKAMRLGELYERQKWQAAKASAVPEWISVDERMPKEGEEVLVHSYGRVQQAICDLAWAGGFKTRNCYGWQATYGQSHWMPKSIKLPESFHFYYEHDAKVAKEKAMIEAQEPSHD